MTLCRFDGPGNRTPDLPHQQQCFNNWADRPRSGNFVKKVKRKVVNKSLGHLTSISWDLFSLIYFLQRLQPLFSPFHFLLLLFCCSIQLLDLVFLFFSQRIFLVMFTLLLSVKETNSTFCVYFRFLEQQANPSTPLVSNAVHVESRLTASHSQQMTQTMFIVWRITTSKVF